MPSPVPVTADPVPRSQPTIFLTTDFRDRWAQAIIAQTSRIRAEYDIRGFYRTPENQTPPTAEFSRWATESVLRYMPVFGRPDYSHTGQQAAMAMLSGAIIEHDLPVETIVPYSFLYGINHYVSASGTRRSLRCDSLVAGAWVFTQSLPLQSSEHEFPILMLGIPGLDARNSLALAIRDVHRGMISDRPNQPQLQQAAEMRPDADIVPDLVAARVPHMFTGFMRPASDAEIVSWFTRLWPDCWYNTGAGVDTEYYFDNLGMLSYFSEARRNRIFRAGASAVAPTTQIPPLPPAEAPSRPRRTTGGNQPPTASPSGTLRIETPVQRGIRIAREEREARAAERRRTGIIFPPAEPPHEGARIIRDVVQNVPREDVDPVPQTPPPTNEIRFGYTNPFETYRALDWGADLAPTPPDPEVENDSANRL